MLPAFILANNRYTRAIAFAITPASPRYGAGTKYPNATITNGADATAPVMTPQPLSFRGRKIIGNKFSTAIQTTIRYSTDATTIPYLFTSDGAFTGDYTVLMLGNPASGGSWTRLLHQGHFDGGSPSNLIIMGNFSGATSTTVSGKLTFFESDGSSINGYGDAASAVDGLPHCFIFRRIAGVHSIWRDGVDITTAQSTSSHSIGAANNTVNLAIGGIFASSPAQNDGANCNFALTVGWNRALSDAEMVKLGLNPFALFFEADFDAIIANQVKPPVAVAINIIQGQAVTLATAIATTTPKTITVATAQAVAVTFARGFGRAVLVSTGQVVSTTLRRGAVTIAVSIGQVVSTVRRHAALHATIVQGQVMTFTRSFVAGGGALVRSFISLFVG